MFEPLENGQIPADLFCHRLENLGFPGEIMELHPSWQELSLGYPRVLCPSDDMEGLMAAMKGLAQHDTEILYVQADHLFLDQPILEEMMDLHHRYYCEYTFGDAWPLGISPEIIRGNILPTLAGMAQGNKEIPKQESLFKLIQRDINRFDIETSVPEIDYRPYRLDFSLSSKEGQLWANQLMAGAYRDSSSLPQWVEERQDQFRLIPAYVQVQLTAKCPQSCSYCPYPTIEKDHRSSNTEMKLDDFKAIIDQLDTLNPQAVVSLSPWGEPALYSGIYEAIDYVMDKKQLKLLFETSGIGWNWEELEKRIIPTRQDWIISLDSDEPEMYKKLRGDGLQEAMDFFQKMHGAAPENTWAQVVRMKENDAVLETMYHRFQQNKLPIIVQKYDHFAQFLESKKLTDLSPVTRRACWHLKRDMVILVDGTVPLCKEDIHKQYSQGNALEEALVTIWERGHQPYLKELQEERPEMCRNCDEYYCYNF